MNATTSDSGHPHTTRLRFFCAPDLLSSIGGYGLERELRCPGTRISAPRISGVAAIVATFPGGVLAVVQEPSLETEQ